MTLSHFAAETRSAIFQDLLSGRAPTKGSYSEAVFLEGKAKAVPQMGAVRYEPACVVFEFIYPNSIGAPIVFPVSIAAPERIVFMPVPEWVVSQIWEGEVAGSYRFESEARELLRAFESHLEPEPNAALFESSTVIGKR